MTGVKARIVVALGDRFPMIAAHKVLAAYGCLVPRLVTGQFDPTSQRAVWPSTGNYCRGGVAISRIMGCRGTAVLARRHESERFEWLQRWTTQADDIVRTPGSESNVKEIYDKCAELAADDTTSFSISFPSSAIISFIICAPGARSRGSSSICAKPPPDLDLAAFVAGTGSAGTLGAGDYLKDRHGTRIVAVEPTACPTSALRRLWRAQYPGHRRQAYPAESRT